MPAIFTKAKRSAVMEANRAFWKAKPAAQRGHPCPRVGGVEWERGQEYPRYGGVLAARGGDRSQ